MPQSIDKYRILVSSPSDVLDERESMDIVITELNHTYGSRTNVILELVKWETHSAPAASETDVQDLIDKDLGSDYDLFIGILWKKFGTPTTKYGSGTEQEFRNAHLRFKQDPKSLQILFYFKTSAPFSLSDIDPLQLEKVNMFKSELGNKGVYYWDYNTNEELQRFLRFHIPKRIDELRKSSTNFETKINLIEQPVHEEVPNEEELGIIDYQEIAEESFGDSTQALLRIAEATEWVGKEITIKTDELTSLTSRKKDISKKVQRDFYRRTANIMNDFANRIEPDIPIFINRFEIGIDAFSNLVTLYRSDLVGTHEENIQEAIDSIKSIASGIQDGLHGMESFLVSVSNLPRMEKQLNRARRNVEIKLKQLINKLEVSYSIAIELYKNLNGQ